MIEGFDESFDELFEDVAPAYPACRRRTRRFLRWRYGPGSPQFPVTVLAVKEGETLLGYAVLMVTSSGQDGYVLDLTTLPERRDVAQRCSGSRSVSFGGGSTDRTVQVPRICNNAPIE
jgi:hypothetical protein